MRKTPHLEIRISFIGHGFQIDVFNYTLATQDGRGVIHSQECHDYADDGPSICDRSEQATRAILKAMRKTIGEII